MSRYGGSTPEAFRAVLCPMLVPIRDLDREVYKEEGENHYRAGFSVEITDESRSVLTRGQTGKFVPGSYVRGESGGTWGEIAKGRIMDVDLERGVASGEIYIGGENTKSGLEDRVSQLDKDDFLEIDQYGAAAKILSGLSEYRLAQKARESGYRVRRMPEDMAKHLGVYAHYDFEFEKEGVVKRVEVKNLWGTDNRYARLIHSRTQRPPGDPKDWSEEQRINYYPTSSCKFEAQDIFAVSLFLRTGSIDDFAFARSVPEDEKEHGLPRSEKYPEHVNQNPWCEIGDGTWFETIDEVWQLE